MWVKIPFSKEASEIIVKIEDVFKQAKGYPRGSQKIEIHKLIDSLLVMSGIYIERPINSIYAITGATSPVVDSDTTYQFDIECFVAPRGYLVH